MSALARLKPEDCHEFEAYSKFLVIMGYNIREFLNKINKIKQKMNQKFNSTTLNILKLLVTRIFINFNLYLKNKNDKMYYLLYSAMFNYFVFCLELTSSVGSQCQSVLTQVLHTHLLTSSFLFMSCKNYFYTW